MASPRILEPGLRENIMMNAGRYYIGDLSYVMHEEWEEICKIILDGYKANDGEFQLSDGRRFAIYRTAFGDGEWDGLSVDTGAIGCILESDIDLSNKKNMELIRLGKIIDFDRDFLTQSHDGIIKFGSFEVDTTDYSRYFMNPFSAQWL